MSSDRGKLFTAFIAVLFGVFALVIFVPSVELIIGLLSLSFGIVAIIWTYRAKTSLSPGTTLREYTNYFLLSLWFIVLFSLWDTLIVLIGLEGGWVYPKYFLITIAYLVFAFTGYKILYMGKQFGFKSQVSRMDLKKPIKKVKKIKK